MSIAAVPSNLTECERIIERGMQSFVEIGRALVTIRDGRLYRASYPTFEAYCEDRWDWSRSRAHRIIEASEVTRALLPIGNTPLPANEGQARELNGLEPEQAAAVMTEAHEATDGKPTAAAIAEARQRLHPVPEPAPEPDAEPPVAPTKAETPPRPRQPPAVLTGDALTRYDAETACKHLGMAILTLNALIYPVHRDLFIKAWPIGAEAATPSQRDHVNPAMFRRIAEALHTFADEWEQ